MISIFCQPKGKTFVSDGRKVTLSSAANMRQLGPLLFIKKQVKYILMSRKQWVFGLGLVGSLVWLGLSLGQVEAGGYPTSAFQPSSLNMVSTPDKYSASVIDLVFIVAFILAFFYLLFGAVSWITSSGESGKLATAKNRMIQAIVGILILASTWAIYSFFLDVTGGNKLVIPSL